MSVLPLYLVVFIGGASVLAIEILGTRILGPYYGVSLFLWSALITITLAALSVGYTVGGRWADRGPRFSRLALILGLAGLWMLAVPWIKRPLLDLLDPLGLRVAVLAASTVLFFPPLLLLGMVSPYAIRLKAHRLEEVGTTAGDIYALSTMASVVAALLTGFVLIPNIGVSRLILLIGVFLLAGAAIAMLASRSGRGATVVAVLVALASGVVAWAVPTDPTDPAAGLIEVRQSPYAEIRVVDWDDSRILFIDGGGHTVVDRGDWRSLYPYTELVELTKFFHGGPGDLLLVGLGGGSIVKNFHRDGWNVDAVEIDPVIAEVAHEYFGLREDEGTIHVMDGREYLLKTAKTYDVIVLDAFGSSAIPFHLVTEEAFALVASRLAGDGVLAINLEANGWYDTIVRSFAATLQTSFAHVRALPMAEPRNEFGNLIMLASNRELEFDETQLGRAQDFVGTDEHWRVIERIHGWDNRFEPDTEGVPVLTDDLNPVDLWAEELNLIARRRLHSQYGWKDLSY